MEHQSSVWNVVTLRWNPNLVNFRSRDESRRRASPVNFPRIFILISFLILGGGVIFGFIFLLPDLFLSLPESLSLLDIKATRISQSNFLEVIETSFYHGRYLQCTGAPRRKRGYSWRSLFPFLSFPRSALAISHLFSYLHEQQRKRETR